MTLPDFSGPRPAIDDPDLGTWISTSWGPLRDAPGQELVDLGDGLTVPARFTFKAENGSAVSVVMDESGPKLEGLVLDSTGDPIPRHRVSRIVTVVQELLDEAVIVTAAGRYTAFHPAFDGVVATWKHEDAQLDAAVRAHLGGKRRTSITKEFLVDVVAWYEEGGVPKIKDEADCSERTARYWLAKAREEGLR